MVVCAPFFGYDKAKMPAIGHDPRLRKSEAKAPQAFFLDCLREPHRETPCERGEHDFAMSVYRCARDLTHDRTAVERLYVTRLCNEFLNCPSDGGMPQSHVKASRPIQRNIRSRLPSINGSKVRQGATTQCLETARN